MTEYARSRSGARKASKQLRKGDTFYTEVEVARNIAPYEDSHLLHRYTVTGTHPLLGGAMVRGTSVEDIIYREGPAYTTRPASVRGVWEPAPQAAGPLPSGKEFGRPLTMREIRDLERRFGKKAAKKIAAEAKAAA